MEVVLSVAAKNKAEKISRITVEVGQLSMVSIDQLRFSLDILKEDTIASKAEIEVIAVPVKMRCVRGHITESFLDGLLFNALQKAKCSICGDSVEIIGGRECYVKEIEVE